MKEKSTISFKEVQSVMNNELDEIVRHAAQKMITTAVNIELSEFMKRYSSLKADNGHHAVVKNGYHKERLVTVNAGTVKVKIPRTRNRVGGENFHSSLIPRYFKRSLTIDAAVPLLYLKGISTNDIVYILAIMVVAIMNVFRKIAVLKKESMVVGNVKNFLALTDILSKVKVLEV